MKRTLGRVAAPVLALGLLAACSGGETTAGDATDSSPSVSESPSPAESPSGPDPADAPGAGSTYCELLGTDFATLFADIQGPEDVEDALGVVDQIVEEAPDEVKQEWRVMSGALGSMEKALKQAAELQELAASGEVDQKELQDKTQQLMQDMQALDTPENAKAGDAVAKHASEHCGIDLGQVQ